MGKKGVTVEKYRGELKVAGAVPRTGSRLWNNACRVDQCNLNRNVLQRS